MLILFLVELPCKKFISKQYDILYTPSSTQVVDDLNEHQPTQEDAITLLCEMKSGGSPLILHDSMWHYCGHYGDLLRDQSTVYWVIKNKVWKLSS